MRLSILARATEISYPVFAMILVIGMAGPVQHSAADDPKPVPQETADPFGLTKVWSLHLEIPAKEFDAMQPALPAFGAPRRRHHCRSGTRTRVAKASETCSAPSFPGSQANSRRRARRLKRSASDIRATSPTSSRPTVSSGLLRFGSTSSPSSNCTG